MAEPCPRRVKHVKMQAKPLLCSLYKHSGLALAQEILERWCGRQFLVILLFHRITDAIPEDGLTIGTAQFRRLCRLVQQKFHPLSLEEVYAILRSGSPMPRRGIAITFDDSYRDNLFAAQTLADHGLPATFFVPTSYVDTDRVCPWDTHLPRMPNLTWEDLRQMVRLGHEIGSHSVNHPNFSTLTSEEAREELLTSRKTIENQLGRPVRWFAYPYGGVEYGRPDLVSLAVQAGYDGCLSGFGGFVLPGCDPYLLPREAVPYFRDLTNLELHLTGCLEWYYALRRRFGSLDNSRSRYLYSKEQSAPPPLLCLGAGPNGSEKVLPSC
jgi:peptidoglycan/xylan/chitin deacetylase (PgdA/CDA1 family)